MDLHASDFNSSSAVWKNRVITAGPVSAANGAFAPLSTDKKTWPTALTIGKIETVVFNVSKAGIAQVLSTSQHAFAPTSLWGNGEWSIEMWVYHTGYNTPDGLAPIFQWAPRPAKHCSSAAIGLGAAAGRGAVSDYGCDMGYRPSTSTVNVTGLGPQPRPHHWHHIAVTYTSTAVAPILTQTLYLNGVVNNVRNVSLSIVRDNPILGAWTDVGGGSFALSHMRAHRGALTAKQILYNYHVELTTYYPSLTPTSSRAPSATATAESTKSHTARVTRTSTMTRSTSK